MPGQHWIAAASYRSATEDRSQVWHLPNGGLVVCIANGAGGMGGGARAAELVIEGVEAITIGPGTDWVRLLAALDEAIERDRDAGESTAVVVEVTPDGKITGASCGDSSAWLLSDDGTIDDLTSDEFRKRRLGSGRALPMAFERRNAEGWIVVASDGLFGVVSEERLVEVLLEGHGDPAQALVEAVKTARGTWLDDVVVVVVRGN